MTTKTTTKVSKKTLEEGMFYEKMFSPERVKVFFTNILGGRSGTDIVGQKLTKLDFTDKNGKTIEVKEQRLISRVLMYLKNYTGIDTISELRILEPDVLQQVLNTAVSKRNKDFKAMYNKEGILVGIASQLHGQVAWSEIRKIVEQAVSEVTGQVVQPEGVAPSDFKWTYKLPVQNENISGWVGVHAGNNIMKGRSGIRVFSRFRTEREGFSDGMKKPACLNWCGMWQFPQQFFQVPMKQLNSIVKVLGEEDVKNIQLLQMHIRPDLKAFKQEVKSEITAMVKSMEKLVPVIETSINSPLSKIEMTEILLAYQSKSRAYLPDYVIEQIMDAVEDETIWGFSQAVSWVRTHGKFKYTDSTNKLFKPLEDRDMVWRLENIAGEVLSLTPTIIDIHKTYGSIDLGFLVGEEKAKEIKQAKAEKQAKEAQAKAEVPVAIAIS